MSATNTAVYVVTGANRGLGLGLVQSLLTRPDTIVVATVRSDEAAQTLQHAITSSAEQARLRVVQLDFTRAVAPHDVHAAISALAGVDHVDVLINNAGAVQPMVPAVQVAAADLRAAFELNTIAPLLVFQGLWPLLQRAAAPKAVWMTSSVGSIGDMIPAPAGAYGPSKAAQNFLTRAVHEQHKDAGLIAFALHPGWVQTRAGQFVAQQWGVASGPPTTIDESVEDMLNVVDTATHETSGKFINQKGIQVAW